MNNAAFRSLVSESPQDDGKTSFKKPVALGSRARNSIPMTPRNVPGYSNNREFARQVAEQVGEPPLKKFKSSAAPKGTKLGAGYVDRAQVRKGPDDTREDPHADIATRLKNLEEQFKLGQIDQAQFESLREQIGVGGDVSTTHLVKGLDWKLLERARRGEDVNQSASKDEDHKSPGIDVDEELERALERDVVASKRDDIPPVADNSEPPQTMSRNEILRRFREQRNAPIQPAAPVLNEKFKKVASTEKSGKKKFVESINGRRREVLVITKRDGTAKRKTRWIDPEDATRPEQQPLGMEIPAEMMAKQKAMLEEEAGEDEDIFADAGNDYDPLADINSDDESGEERELQPNKTETGKKRNYFSTGKDEEDSQSQNPMTHDPTILAAFKRAAQIRQESNGAGGLGIDQQAETEAGAKSSAFLAKLKERERQDAADLDYGFGESRFGDDDDEGPIYDGEEEKKSGRKRGPKKRKGDKDNVQDVMNVLEGRKK